MPSHPKAKLLLLLLLGLSTLVMAATAVTGCGANKDMRVVSRSDAGTGTLSLELDAPSPVTGAPSRGRDPAVLAIDVAGETLCTGTLIASNLLLTARRCVTIADWDACLGPPADREPSSLTIYEGDDPAPRQLLARGREVLGPVLPDGASFCDADLALVVLDRDISELTPLPVRDEVAEKAERIRTVSFGQRHIDGRAGDPTGKLVREHVAVIDVAGAQFQVAEAPCQGGPGGPAIDEGTGEVLGVLTHSSISCDGPDVHNVYVRVDLHRALIEQAVARAKQVRSDDLDLADAGRPRAKNPKKSKPPTDVGQPCPSGVDCTTGICVREQDHAYCSRSCGGGDRCLAGYRCKDVTNVKACITSL